MNLQKSFTIILLTMIALLLIILLAFYFTSGDPLFDFTAFWIAANLTLKGQDPYLMSDWTSVYSQYETLGLADNQTFLYPKPILLLFLPFGALPLQTASIIWLVLTQIAVLVSVILLASTWQVEKPGKYLIPLLVGTLIFRPYLLSLNLGQLSGLLLLILTDHLASLAKTKLAWRRDHTLIIGIKALSRLPNYWVG